jgi:AraC-like DNA-binding protein
VFFVLTGFCVAAQENTLQIEDSLKTQPFDSLKSQFYKYEYKDLRISEKYAEAMLWSAQNNENSSQIHQAQHYNARVSTSLGRKDIALSFIEKALHNSQTDNDSVYIIKNTFLKGKIYADFGEYSKAIDNYLLAQDMVKNEPDQIRFHGIAHNIAVVKNQIGDLRNTVETTKNNLQFFHTLDEQKAYFHIINCHLLLASAYSKLAIKHQRSASFKKTYIDSSFYYIDKGFEKAITYEDTEAQAMLTSALGINYYEIGEFERSLNIFQEAEKRSTELNILKEFPIIYLFQGKSYYSLKQYDKAIEHLQKAITASETINIDFPYLQEILIVLVESYKAIGDNENVIKYYDLYHEKKAANELLNEQNNTSLYEKYDIPSFEDRMRKLKEENTRIEGKNKFLVYIAWGLLAALLVIVTFYLKRQYQYKKRFEKLLIHINTLEQQKANPQKEVSAQKTIKPQPDRKTIAKKQPKIADEKVTEILKNLEKFEKKEQFLSNKCTLNYVAKKVNTNSTYFSIVLQNHKKKKFVQYITDLRIEYVLQRLKNDGLFRSYDIKSIAQEVGFNTAESFSKAFKKRTGIYPSFFIKNLEKLDDN